VVIEDAVHGIEAAQRAGMIGIALIGTASGEQLARADLVVESLHELIPSVLRRMISQRDSNASK
jgi:beta-phosphoglucomutase-like phosphatase (HAD superfamily)